MRETKDCQLVFMLFRIFEVKIKDTLYVYNTHSPSNMKKLWYSLHGKQDSLRVFKEEA